MWGLSFVAQSEGASIGTFTFNALRMMLGGTVLIPLVIFSHKKENKNLPAGEKKKFQFKEVFIGGACCGLALFAGSNLQQQAFFLGLGTAKVGFLTALYMIIVPLAGIFMKRKLRFNIWLGVALGLAGLFMLCLAEGELSIGMAEIIAICGAFAFAAHILIIDYFCQKVDNVALSCVQFFIAGILSLVCMLISEKPDFNAIKDAWLEIAYAGVMSCGVAFTVQIFGQKYSNPTVASVLLCLECVFATIFGWLILGQTLDSLQTIGCVVMFIAIMLTQIPTEVFLKPFKRKSR